MWRWRSRRPAARAICSARTASRSPIRPSAICSIWRPSRPTRAPTTCTPSCSESTSPVSTPSPDAHPGGHPILRPPRTWRWMWNTTWWASGPVLITARQPLLSRPCSRATCSASANTGAITLPSPTSFSDATCFFGITNTCTGMQGLMSGNAIAPSFSATFFAGTFPATILQKTQSSMGSSEQLLRVQQQRHRTLIDDAHLHGGPKHPFPDLHAARPHLLAELRVERLGHLRPGGIDETRPGPLPGISEQRELRDGQHPSADIQQGSIHLPLLVLEHAQVAHLVRQPPRILVGISLPDPDEHAKPLPHGTSHLAADQHRSLAHPLHDGPHGAAIPPNLCVLRALCG